MSGAAVRLAPQEQPGAAKGADFLEDVSVRQMVLDLYDSEHVALRRYVYFLGVDQETARELLQEIFLRLHTHLQEGGDRSNLRAWLYRVAHNLTRNEQTATRTSRTDPLADSAAQTIPAKLMSVEEEVLEKERAQRFQEALRQLSMAQRECLALRARGLKYREIAEALGISVSSVGENIERGMRRMKELL